MAAANTAAANTATPTAETAAAAGAGGRRKLLLLAAPAALAAVGAGLWFSAFSLFLFQISKTSSPLIPITPHKKGSLTSTFAACTIKLAILFSFGQQDPFFLLQTSQDPRIRMYNLAAALKSKLCITLGYYSTTSSQSREERV